VEKQEKKERGGDSGSFAYESANKENYRFRRRAPQHVKPPTRPKARVEGSGTGVAETVKLSTRSVPAAATVPPLALVVDMSTKRKTTVAALSSAVTELRSMEEV
jgi:hypothetical protein